MCTGTNIPLSPSFLYENPKPKAEGQSINAKELILREIDNCKYLIRNISQHLTDLESIINKLQTKLAEPVDTTLSEYKERIISGC